MTEAPVRTADRPVRVLVHSHHRFLRDGVARLLDDAAELIVVGRSHRARDLGQIAAQVEPDVVIVHVDLLDLDLVPAVDALRRGTPPIRVVAIGSRFDAGQWGSTRRSSVDVFVPATAGAESLIAAVLGDDRRAEDDIDEPAHRLTAREQRVLELVGHGLRAREISGVLGITTKTVENHKQRIFAKLGVQNQAHAVTLAVRAGVLSLRPELRVSGDG